MSTWMGDVGVTFYGGAVEGWEKLLPDIQEAVSDYIRSQGGELLTWEWGSCGISGEDAEGGASYEFTWPPNTSDGYQDGVMRAVEEKFQPLGWQVATSAFAQPKQ